MKHRNQNILETGAFLLRMIKFFCISLGLILISLSIGVLGYHKIADLSWIDSIYNAALILTGMGPVNPMVSDDAKLFASGYALFSGIVFLSTVAIFFSPIAHRLLHLLHVEPDNDDENNNAGETDQAK